MSDDQTTAARVISQELCKLGFYRWVGQVQAEQDATAILTALTNAGFLVMRVTRRDAPPFVFNPENTQS